MKKIVFPFLFTCLIVTAFGQIREIDSLNQLLAVTKEDTTKVMVLARLSFYDQSFQNGLQLAREGLALAKKIGYKKGEGQCLHQIGNQFVSISNLPIGLQYYLEGLKIRESIDDKKGIASSYGGIGTVYMEQGDYKNALSYFLRAIEIQKILSNTYYLAIVSSNIGDVYLSINMFDSALIYYQRSYEYFNTSQDKYQMSKALNGLGNVQLKMGNTELALGYYRIGIRNATVYSDSSGLPNNYIGIAEFYKNAGQVDSGIVYAKQALMFAQQGQVQPIVIKAGKLLAQLYWNKNDKEALKYLNIAMDARDSTFSTLKNTQTQNMLYNEQERQQEIIATRVKEEEQRKHNLQYALVGIGLIGFLIIFLLLSHSIIVKTGLIRFFGVVLLLLVFEFINLFIHPFIAHATNDSPLLMLLAMVCIAALLIPAHHRLEKWITNKLMEKNKTIRLIAAKKTIEQLEGK
jgi:tetratricopeptide (TPR) repeat protein